MDSDDIPAVGVDIPDSPIEGVKSNEVPMEGVDSIEVPKDGVDSDEVPTTGAESVEESTLGLDNCDVPIADVAWFDVPTEGIGGCSTEDTVEGLFETVAEIEEAPVDAMGAEEPGWEELRASEAAEVGCDAEIVMDDTDGELGGAGAGETPGCGLPLIEC
jgi:hypothetical protein